MIIVVQGPSAAGKTTWCQLHAPDFVAEYASTGAEPDDSDLAAQAAYWGAVNSRRWARALDLERRTGLAVCDSDPLKLHYTWSLATIGVTPWTRLAQELDATRRAVAAGTLGFADLVLVSIPSPAVLAHRRDSDRQRRRHSFAVHAQLAEPLRHRYRAVDALDPGRVIWELPPRGMPEPLPAPRRGRGDVALLDQLVALLPS